MSYGGKSFTTPAIRFRLCNDAANVLVSYYSERGWLVENVVSSTGGMMLLIERNSGEESGIVFVNTDARDQNYSTIFATVFP